MYKNTFSQMVPVKLSRIDTVRKFIREPHTALELTS